MEVTLKLNRLSDQQFWLITQFTSIKHPPLHALSLVVCQKIKPSDAAAIAGCNISQISRAKRTINSVLEELNNLALSNYCLNKLTENELEALATFLKKDLTSSSFLGLKKVLYMKQSQTEAAINVGCRKQAISSLIKSFNEKLSLIQKIALTIR